jgi:hypothetical protein
MRIFQCLYCRKTGLRWIVKWKQCWGKRSRTNFIYCLGTRLKEPRKPTKYAGYSASWPRFWLGTYSMDSKSVGAYARFIESTPFYVKNSVILRIINRWRSAANKHSYRQKLQIIYLVQDSYIYLLTCLLNYLLIYLLTYSMEQSPSWEANWFCS